MARLDDLVARITDRALRVETEGALADLKRRQRFGLVFEEHIPEMCALLGLPITKGSLVQRRTDSGTLFRVAALDGGGGVARSC